MVMNIPIPGNMMEMLSIDYTVPFTLNQGVGGGGRNNVYVGVNSEGNIY